MPDKPVIIQFETDEFYQYTLDLVLYNMNLDSSIKVTNKEETREIVKKIEAKTIKPDVVIVDTYMGIDNEDGSKIAAKIREFSPNTKIVGYSIMETKEWADFEIIKSARDANKTVVKILEEALGRTFNYSKADDPEQLHSH